MNWMNKLERRLGKYAIHNLMYYIIILYGIGFVLNMVNPQLYVSMFALDPAKILRGEIWRIVTFLLYPPTGSFLFILFSLYMYYMIGRTLEYQWGAFRFNLYFFTGVLLHVLVSLLLYLFTGQSFMLGTYFLNFSLFFAFAATYPDMEFLLFFILPIKAKWLGIIDGLYFAVTIFAGFFSQLIPFEVQVRLLSIGIIAVPEYSIAALVSLGNFLLFFLCSRSFQRYSPKQVKRRRTYTTQVKKAETERTHHKCAICGRTEKDGDHLEFRFCSKCDGHYEYCQDHLFTHEHVKKR